jgi:hypothetical protein
MYNRARFPSPEPKIHAHQRFKQICGKHLPRKGDAIELIGPKIPNRKVGHFFLLDWRAEMERPIEQRESEALCAAFKTGSVAGARLPKEYGKTSRALGFGHNKECPQPINI